MIKSFIEWVKELWRLSKDVYRHCYKHPIKYIIYFIGTYMISYCITYLGLSAWAKHRENKLNKLTEKENNNFANEEEA